MKVKEYDINQLISAEYNPRQLSQRQYQNLRNSIQRFGLVDPILINVNKKRKNIIIGGHQRVNIAKVLGIEKVPCVELDLTLEQERELNIRLNQNTGDWDFDILADNFDLNELIDFGFEEKDLKLDMFEEEKEGLTDDDDIPEDVESVCKLGDLWKLGNHRLLCGDSTKKENIELLLDGNKADMLFTDPPYGISFKGQVLSHTSKNGKKVDNYKVANTNHNIIKNDELTDGDLYSFCYNFLEAIKKTNISSWYICFSQLDLDILLQAMRKNKMEWRSIIAWVKNQATLSNKDYKLRYEPIVYGQSGGSFYGKRYKQEDVWEIQRTLKNDLHPTMKPIDLIVKAINNSSKKDDIVLDVFLGSGSTLIACEKTNRVCYGMELDPHYCDVIINRWEQYTGKKAELING
jgi:DNA modification methylase